MTAWERADRDREHGDLGQARRRLASRLRSGGYDAELLVKLGEISMAMHDPVEAGRYWLVSPASGAEVDEAISAFLQHAGSSPAMVGNRIPPTVRLTSIQEYPEIVQQRLVRLNLSKGILRGDSKLNEVKRTHVERLLNVAILVGLVIVCVFAVIGMISVKNWLWAGK